MKFGKVENISNVNFSLPNEPTRNELLLKNLPKKKGKTKVYLGCTGWGMKEWIGTVYPKGAKPANYLHHYSRQFNTIEFNTTHYRTPNEQTIQKWYAESAEDFKFCPKVLQQISHTRDLGYGSGKIQEFCRAVSGLKEKLGCCFMQLPPYFGVDRLPILKLFFEKWPSEIPLAIEVRHESWFSHPDHFSKLVQLAENQNIALVITDVSGRRDVLHLALTSAKTMIRFVGNGLHETDFTRLDKWVAQLKKWWENGLSEIYFFPHEPDNILAPEATAYLFEKLQDFEGIDLRGPNLLNTNLGEQMSLF
ncbi:MAG: hypothetical protein ACI9XO_001744 [Paraglaciecola sp.]|jgi:uncharacterized protein YecE (DUF72 family)